MEKGEGSASWAPAFGGGVKWPREGKLDVLVDSGSSFEDRHGRKGVITSAVTRSPKEGKKQKRRGPSIMPNALP